MKLSFDFYVREDVVQISRELLGKVLCTKFNGQITQERCRRFLIDRQSPLGDTVRNQRRPVVLSQL